MGRTQQVVDVGEGGLGERAQRLTGDDEHLFAEHLLDLRPSAEILR